MLFFNRKRSPSTDPVTLYKKYRTTGTQLSQKVLKSPCMTKTSMESAGRLLGILQGKTFVFEQEEEEIALTDFLFFDYRPPAQKTLVERYAEEIGGKGADEEAILTAWQSAYSSLFKVTEVSSAEHLITLSDVFHPGATVQLMDLSFSQTAVPGLLFFTRIVPFAEFNTTSGCTFVFPETREKHIMTKYKSLVKKVKTPDERIQRFICFFKLNRTYGMEVSYR
jgi:hypothetical protein